MRLQPVAIASVLLLGTTLCSAQTQPPSPAASPSVNDELRGAQMYRQFVGTGEGTIVVDTTGRIVVFQALDIPVDGKQWRILTATPRQGINLPQGHAEGNVIVKADYHEGVNRGFDVELRPWNDGGSTVHVYFALTNDRIDAPTDSVQVIPVLGVQSTTLSDEQVNQRLEVIANSSVNEVGDAWGLLLLESTDLSDLFMPMGGGIDCSHCAGGGVGATSCTIVDGIYSKSVTCSTGTYACCGGSGSGIWAVCCQNPQP